MNEQERKAALERVRERCKDDAGCWIWQNATSKAGYPLMKPSGRRCLLVRRWVMELVGLDPAGKLVTASCGDKRCCNPEHLYTSTHAAIAKQAAKRGAFSSATRAAKIAKARRAGANTKLTEAIAAEIRASSDTHKTLAARYSVSTATVWRIRSGAGWKNYASPWAGMGAR